MVQAVQYVASCLSLAAVFLIGTFQQVSAASCSGSTKTPSAKPGDVIPSITAYFNNGGCEGTPYQYLASWDTAASSSYATPFCSCTSSSTTSSTKPSCITSYNNKASYYTVCPSSFDLTQFSFPSSITKNSTTTTWVWEASWATNVQTCDLSQILTNSSVGTQSLYVYVYPVDKCTTDGYGSTKASSNGTLLSFSSSDCSGTSTYQVNSTQCNQHYYSSYQEWDGNQIVHVGTVSAAFRSVPMGLAYLLIAVVTWSLL